VFTKAATIDPLVKRTLHHMFLLDRIVGKLADDREYMRKMRPVLEALVTKATGSTSRIAEIWKMYRAAGLFGVAKQLTLNKGIDGILGLRDRNAVTPAEAKERSDNLSYNILEATATDFMNRKWDNGKVGWSLTWAKAQGVEVSGENRIVKYGTNLDWARVYETWNLAFCTGNLHFLNVLYPKLLTPKVLLASGPDYMYNRALALWLSLNFYLLADLDGKPHVKFAGQDELAALWGKINLRYTNYLNGSFKLKPESLK